MKLLADLHTHSNNSRFFHGKNSIEEMAREANAIGLKEIAITDHGFKHMCRTSKAKLAKARKTIDEINEWSTTKVLLGIEADIIAEDGTLDVDNDTLSLLDVLVVGYHKMISTDFAGFFGGQEKTEEAKRRCTNAYLNAIQRYPITMISHLDSILSTDLYAIGVACREKGVVVEINNRHTNWTEEQMFELLASECLFAVSSDAHSRGEVGRVDRAFELIKKYNIPSEYVVNVEFEDYEKSEADLAIKPYLSIYNERKKAREEKLQRIEEKKRKEFTNNLSDEMETALKDIAREKGIKYTPLEEDDVESEEDLLNFDNFIDEYGRLIGSGAREEFDKQNDENINFEESVQPEEVQLDETDDVELIEESEPVQEVQAEPETPETTESEKQVTEPAESKEVKPVRKPRGFGFQDIFNDIKQDKK